MGPSARSAPSMFDSDDEDAGTHYSMSGTRPPAPASFSSPPRRTRGKSMLHRSKPRSIRTPSSPMASTIPYNNLPSAPASPPTPAPSPSPHQRLPDWSTADEGEEVSARDIRRTFKESTDEHRKRLLAELMNMCDNRLLTFVHEFVCPRLKKDPFTMLPNELCLRVSQPI